MQASRVLKRVQYDQYDTIRHIEVSKLVEASREYKMPLCLTFIDLKKAFDTLTEAVMEASDNQGASTLEVSRLTRVKEGIRSSTSPIEDRRRWRICQGEYH
ncbi:hypothetical protein RB195_014832 [Necator americanus]|uniref:Reverse transcriptase domain-containing protein n=1 Tax=Necator americanus TaxID=51031 RepID=A0ABR1E1U4_NECAM